MGVARWLGWVVFAAVANAQRARVCVVDTAGRPVQGATMLVRTQTAQSGVAAAMDASSCANVAASSAVDVTMKGFAPVTVTGLPAGTIQRVVMRPIAAQENVTVTADRGLAGINDAASSVAVLTPEKLKAAPELTLDDRLHQVAGFQLFRRTSSWTANPTSSGVSLRALGSTAASRTLVVSDQVPMNDPFGGWVHWTEIPEPSIRDVELVRGDFVKLDFGALVDGYHSDMTRTFVLSPVAQWQLDVYDLVATAQRRGRESLAPGVSLSGVDGVSRQVIADAGFADNFGHGLGHGVGLQIHEAPGISASSAGTLLAGSAVTVEPGVYLPGRGGVRIEDTLVVGSDDNPTPELLTRFPKELAIL